MAIPFSVFTSCLSVTLYTGHSAARMQFHVFLKKKKYENILQFRTSFPSLRRVLCSFSYDIAILRLPHYDTKLVLHVLFSSTLMLSSSTVR